MKLGTVLAAVAVLCLVGTAMGEDAKPKSRGFMGQVVSVGDDGKVVVKVGDKEVTVTTDANTAVTLDGKDAKVADLKKDLYVTVMPGEGTATKIIATTEKPTYKPKAPAPGGAGPSTSAQNPG